MKVEISMLIKYTDWTKIWLWFDFSCSATYLEMALGALYYKANALPISSLQEAFTFKCLVKSLDQYNLRLCPDFLIDKNNLVHFSKCMKLGKIHLFYN